MTHTKKKKEKEKKGKQGIPGFTECNLSNKHELLEQSLFSFKYFHWTNIYQDDCNSWPSQNRNEKYNKDVLTKPDQPL